MATILIVDDSATSRGYLVAVLLETGHRLLTASDGAEALEVVRAERPQLVITDILMPVMDGYEFVRRLRGERELARTPVIFHTSSFHEEEARALARSGGVCQFLVKPVEPGVLLAMVEAALGPTRPPTPPPVSREFVEEHLRLLTNKLLEKVNALESANNRLAALVEELRHSHRELAEAYDTTLEGWVRALDLRDRETEGHTQRVTEMALRLGRALGLSEAELPHLRRGALLHDIGKIGIPDHILRKPGPLTPGEWEVMRQHPGYARQMLAGIPYLRPALDVAYYHHERWDGGGYPCGLRGEQIPLAARIFAVADVWDALRFDRPYRAGWPEEKVRAYLREQAGKHFDPRVVEAFLSLGEGAACAGCGGLPGGGPHRLMAGGRQDVRAGLPHRS
jgi:putative two-component system response regulator